MEDIVKNFLQDWMQEIQEIELKTKFEFFLIDEIETKINERQNQIRNQKETSSSTEI